MRPLPDPPIVAHLTTSLDTGGAQIMLAKLIEAAAGCARHPRHAVVSLMPPGAVAVRLHACQCPVYDLAMKRGWPTPRSVLQLLRITGSLNPDLIQGWMYHGNVAASMAGAMRRAPVVWNVRHSLSQISCESRATRFLLDVSARLARRTSAIVYNSQTAATEHETIGFPSDRAIVIPNGFDCARFSPDRSRRVNVRSLFGIRDDVLLVGMVARLHPMKDHVNLVEAVGRARQAGHDLHLLLVGTGLDAPPPSLARAIAELLPADRVTLVGERTDVSDWLAGLDIAALPSAWGEAFPNVLGEAMACGVPCVATSIGDCNWIVDRGGIVVPPRDSQAMAKALIDLAGIGPEARRHIGGIGRARVVEHFTLEGVAHQYRRLYERVLAEPHARPPHRTRAATSVEARSA
jgi:glycosyltransferase involved in cell wall biosynthesis